MKYQDEVYTPTAVRRGLIDFESAIEEIKRLRDVVTQRMRRLAKSKTFTDYDRLMKSWVELPPYVKEIRTASNPDLAAGVALAKLYAMANDYTLSLSGIAGHRKRTLEGLHNSRKGDYSFVNANNLDDFSDFMDWSRNFMNEKMFDSKRVAQWWRKNEGQFDSDEQLEKAFLEWSYNTTRGRIRVED